MHDVKKFFWDEPYLYRICVDGIIRRYVPEVEMLIIVQACHLSRVGRHYSGIVLCTKFYCVGIAGLPSTKMLMILERLVTIAKEKEEFQRGKRFL